jgi:hypothetical protein
MKLNEIKEILPLLTTINFILPDGSEVPGHFHVTEVGKVTKHFIDCGGTVRSEEVVNFQLWNANDYDHRLHPEKLLKIIKLSEDKLQLGNYEIEVEYQGDTIQKFALDFKDNKFFLISKQTDCLAKDKCGITEDKLISKSSSCTPGSGCC